MDGTLVQSPEAARSRLRRARRAALASFSASQSRSATSSPGTSRASLDWRKAVDDVSASEVASSAKRSAKSTGETFGETFDAQVHVPFAFAFVASFSSSAAAPRASVEPREERRLLCHESSRVPRCGANLEVEVARQTLDGVPERRLTGAPSTHAGDDDEIAGHGKPRASTLAKRLEHGEHRRAGLHRG